MIDTHAHIDFEAFDDDRSEMIKRAFDNAVEYIIIPGVEPKNYLKLLALAESNKRLFCGLGVHPHNALDANDSVFETIRELSEKEKVVAIGETGIDYFYDFAPKEVQKDVFRKHLQIAKQKSLPVIVHNREADDDILDIIKSEQDGTLKGVLHCFSGSPEVMEKALNLGFIISFTGNITFKKSQLTDVVKKIPLDSIMLETDSPFMTPDPFRGKRNEPANVKYIAQKIAEIKSISIDEVIAMTSKTAKQLFNLSIILLTFILAFSVTESQSILKDIKRDSSTQEEMVHPYPKFIGFGPVIGTNTVVETWYIGANEKDDSYDGLLAYGGALTYGVFDYLVVKLSYCYSKNIKIAEQWDYTIDPSVYQFYELSTHWIINPYSRINFFGTLGITSFNNSYNNIPNNQIGWNSGLGMFINIPTDFGLFNVMAEWHINFETQKQKKYSDEIDKENNIFTDTKSYYSIPRVTLLYYPPIKEWILGK